MPSLTQKIRKGLKTAAKRVGSLFTRRRSNSSNLPPIMTAEEYMRAPSVKSPSPREPKENSAKVRSKAINEAAKALRLQKAAFPSPNYPPVYRHRGNKNTSSLSDMLKDKLRAKVNAQLRAERIAERSAKRSAQHLRNSPRSPRNSRYSNMSLRELEESLEEL